MNRLDLFRSANVNRLEILLVPGVLTTDLFALHSDSDICFQVMPKVRFCFFLLQSQCNLIKKPCSIFNNLKCSEVQSCYKNQPLYISSPYSIKKHAVIEARICLCRSQQHQDPRMHFQFNGKVSTEFCGPQVMMPQKQEKISGVCAQSPKENGYCGLSLNYTNSLSEFRKAVPFCWEGVKSERNNWRYQTENLSVWCVFVFL